MAAMLHGQARSGEPVTDGPEATALRGWRIPAAFEDLRSELRRRVRRPDQEWVRVLRLLREHPPGAVEAAVAEALRRGTPGSASVVEILRQAGAAPAAVAPVTLDREDLARVVVHPPVLAAYDEVSR